MLIYDHNGNNKIDKIFYDIHQSANIFTTELNIYNPTADTTLQKFWVKIDKAKLQRKTKSQIRLAIFNKDTNLVEFMESLDTKINELVSVINSKIESFSTSLELSDTYSPMINLDIDDETRVFSNNNELVNLYTIANGSHVSILIELESVKMYGVQESKRWRVKQMKENKIIDLDVSLFGNNTQPIQQKPVQQPYVQPPQYMQHPPQYMQHPPQYMQQSQQYIQPSYTSPQYVQQPVHIPPPPPLAHMQQTSKEKCVPVISNTAPRVATVEPPRAPTAAELLGALQKLKKLKKVPDKKKEDRLVVDSASITTLDLKKVVTREPVSVVDIMKKEYIDKRISDMIKYILETQPSVDMIESGDMLKKYRKSFKKNKLTKQYKILMKGLKNKLFN